MVFTNLQNNEKEAFFSLLDEYFTSRPELLKKLGSSSDNAVAEAGSKLASAGWKHALSRPNQFNTNPNASHSPPPIAEKPSSVAGLISSKRLGDLDTSSTKNMIGSLYSGNKDKNPPAQAAPVPSAFGAKKNMFAPPPVRTASVTAPSPPQRHQPAKEEEEQGEWAEALYDYDSGEPGDLAIKENERVLVTERNSDEWWTGEYKGRKGLFPASYVKIL